MKRFIPILTTTVVISLLSACGGANSNASNATETKNEATSAVEATPQVATQTQKVVSESETKEESQTPDDGVSFEEITAIDNDVCLLRLTELSINDSAGCSVRAYLENKSPDKTYIFKVKGAAINGLQIDPSWSSGKIEPGANLESNIVFSKSKLESNSISKIDDIELNFRVYDPDSQDAADVASETVHIYPYGEENASSGAVEQKGDVIFDNDKVSVSVTGYEKNEEGYSTDLMLTNKTASTVTFGVDEAKVNGVDVDPIYGEDVLAGKTSASKITWFSKNEVDKVSEIEFTLQAYNANEKGYYANEKITLKPTE